MHEHDLAEACAKIEATSEALKRLPVGGDLRRAIARLERLAGELRRVEKMVERSTYMWN